MPLYDFLCNDGHTTEGIRGVAVTWIVCPTCGLPAERQISKPVIRTDSVDAYYDHGLGERIESRSQRQRLMKASGLVEKGTTEMSGAKGTVYSHPGRATESVPKSGAQLGPLR